MKVKDLEKILNDIENKELDIRICIETNEYYDFELDVEDYAVDIHLKDRLDDN